MEPRVQGSPIILVAVGSVLVGNGWKVDSTALRPQGSADMGKGKVNSPLKRVIPMALLSCSLAWLLTKGNKGGLCTTADIAEIE